MAKKNRRTFPKKKTRQRQHEDRRALMFDGEEHGEPRSQSSYQRKNPRTVHIVPKTPNQQGLFDNIHEYEQNIVLGPAGTGKTYIPASLAAKAKATGQVDKIVFSRPNVPAGPELGHRPGDLKEKVAEWAAPVLDVLKEHLGGNEVERAIGAGEIEFVPFESMRGRSFKDCFVILDEAQNVTEAQMHLFLTRIGDGCTTVVDGDIRQKDIPRKSGLAYILRVARKYSIPVGITEFEAKDNQRGRMSRLWVEADLAETYGDLPDEEIAEAVEDALPDFITKGAA